MLAGGVVSLAMLELRFLLDAMKNLHHEYDGLIFDLDGTLADTMPTHFAAWSQSMAEHGLVLSEERFYALGGVPASEIIELLAKEQGKVVDAVAIAEEKKTLFMELLGAVLLLLGLRSYGAGVLIAYLIPMSLISHTFVVKRGIDMTQFLPFLQGLALVGSLIVMGSYSEEEDDRPVSIENSRDVQREANKMDFQESELPPSSSDRTGLYRRR